MRVLYLHPFAPIGGATKSLVEMFSALPANEVDGYALVPKGRSSAVLESVGIKVIPVLGVPQFDDTRYGYYRRFRWLILLREAAYCLPAMYALWKLRETQPDLIHCNEITALAIGVLAKRWLNAPLVVHVRSLQRGNQGSRITATLMKLLKGKADAIVAIDQAVQRTLPTGLPVEVIHNGLRLPECREADSVGPQTPFQLAVVGVLHRSKGLYELIEAMGILHQKGVSAKLYVVGENARNVRGVTGWILRKLDFARDVRAELEAVVAEKGLTEQVEFTGFVGDISNVYMRVDAVCFPSHLDAPGRPVFEAALYGLPTIVAMKNPTNDVIVDGQTGLCIESPEPYEIAGAIEKLAGDRVLCRMMGRTAREMAEKRFDSRVTAKAILNVYKNVIESFQKTN